MMSNTRQLPMRSKQTFILMFVTICTVPTMPFIEQVVDECINTSTAIITLLRIRRGSTFFKSVRQSFVGYVESNADPSCHEAMLTSNGVLVPPSRISLSPQRSAEFPVKCHARYRATAIDWHRGASHVECRYHAGCIKTMCAPTYHVCSRSLLLLAISLPSLLRTIIMSADDKGVQTPISSEQEYPPPVQRRSTTIQE